MERDELLEVCRVLGAFAAVIVNAHTGKSPDVVLADGEVYAERFASLIDTEGAPGA